MNVFDDKTKGIILSGEQFILPVFEPCDEAIFKASYIIASDVDCKGKITALFDLTVLGNVSATELDVKGRFICTGKCKIDGTLIVQHDIWVDDVFAKTVESRERIIAQGIDVTDVKVDGDIIIGKCLAVENLAYSGKTIICGETAYGAGKVAASIVITGEAIDLDEGVEAVVNPNVYYPNIKVNSSTKKDYETALPIAPDFISDGNWSGYIDWLVENSLIESEKEVFLLWKDKISTVDELIRSGSITDCRDLVFLIWMTDIASSDSFNDWSQVIEMQMIMDRHFKSVINKNDPNIICKVENYSDLLYTLSVLNRHGDKMDSAVYELGFELLISNLGIKSKFMIERLNEKGWKAHE